jgi:hypothetical protein
MTKDEALDKALEALEQYTNVVTSVNDPNSWETVVDGGKPARDAITAIKQARSAPEEPVYHLRQFGDVTKEQLDRYMATGDINPQPAPVQEPVAWMKEGWGPDCGPYIEFYRDDEMGWRDRKEWTPLYTTPPAAPVQEPDEWPTGCPECGMDSGCDCDSGTWNPPAAPVQEFLITDEKGRPMTFWGGKSTPPAAQPAPVQDLPFGVGGGLVAIKTLLSRDPCVHANTAIEMIDAILKEHPAAQRQWVGLNWEDMPDIRAGDHAFLSGAQWAEAKLKEKNT